MSSRGTRIISGITVPLLLASCGSAGVDFRASAPGTPANATDIVDAAQRGFTPISLPITRIVFQPPGTTTVNNPVTNAGAKAAPGGAAAKSTDTSDSGAGAISSDVVGNDGKKYTFSMVQIEGDNSFRVRGVNDFFSSNQLGITFLANTRVPTSISNTFTDQTASRIKAIAQLVTSALSIAGVVGLGGPPVACTPTPISIDLGSSSNGLWTETHGCYTVTVKSSISPNAAHQSDSVPASYFKSTVSEKGAAKIWPVPACMNVSASVVNTLDGSTVIQDADLTVIDPDYVQVYPVPGKGKISMHPICGADFADSPVDKYQDAFDSITALENAVPKKAGNSASSPTGSSTKGKTGT